ncbi:hypothetical protein [Arthrobacter bambusae]|uniref:Uncharacterized protein n=1 Tax=Arthrobacter bambusae TaxID=1338426 RepID=A0AAW8DK25_9MICC|nr:hypothetical protein [Arthrobacter bambusae]MDP9906211.1 hypothetical protein [Arthrobacter bambusae]MDQ0130556.1 hypothetical protein [Arthrobacter bambusae]MDQ0182231.1 hypothetical protein [Arthrobacter bambusae]
MSTVQDVCRGENLRARANANDHVAVAVDTLDEAAKRGFGGSLWV